MKKKNLFAAILFVAFVSALVSTKQALAQEDGVYFRTVFEVIDSQNNRDTVTFVSKEGATRGIDEHLGEVNLYGVPPQGDLDMRIIQRTTINRSYGEGGLDFWLGPTMSNEGCSWCYESPSTENIDLKVNYRDRYPVTGWGLVNTYAIKIYAQHYPVSIYVIEIDYDNTLYYLFAEWALFNEEDGWYIKESHGNQGSSYYLHLPRHLYTFTEPSDNNLVWLRQSIGTVSVDDVSDNQQLLYPNPSREFVVIENGNYGEVFTVVDTNGKTVRTVTVESYPYSLDIRDLLNGAYFLKNREGSVIQKFIKE